jgi:hypothetical protein
MIIKSKSLIVKTTILVLVVIILSFLSFNAKDLKIERENILQYLMSMDLGFSSRYNLVDDGREEFHGSSNELENEYNKLVNFETIKSIPKIIEYKLFANDSFERIDIDIKYINYQKIMRDRSASIKTGKKRNATKVNAILKHKGKRYKAKLRLKGDLSGHWLSKYRMSFRVELKNKKSIFGYTKFSLQKPREREYPYDDIFQKLNLKIGNLSSSHKYINLYVNGENWGIMNMEEHVSKEFLEKQNRKDSPIIRFTNEKSWFYRTTTNNNYSLYRLKNRLDPRFYNNKSRLKNYHNRIILSYISKKYRNHSKDLYDIDSFAKSFILSTFWGSFHPLSDGNSKYYFNPYTLKVEPITLDSGQFMILNNPDEIPFKKHVSNIYPIVLSTQKYIDNFNKNLKYTSNIATYVQKYFNNISQIFPIDKVKNSKIVVDNIDKVVKNKEKYYTLSGKPKEKFMHIPTKKQASEFDEHLYIRHYTDGTLELHNLLPDVVSVKDILFNGTSISIKDTVVPSYLSHPKPTVIKTPYKGIQDGMFTVNTKYQGFNRTIKNDITLISDGIDNPLLLNTVSKFDFINKLDSNTFEIKQGSWTVNKPIIVDGDLHISSGVNLQFSEDAYIIVKGSLTAIGGEANPITLKAISDSWKGIYVLNADKKSHLKNVSVSNLSALEDELLKLTGGITFYKSDVDFENVRINDIKAEDALNIVESKFALNSVYINNTVSDGLDSDFSKGSVLNSEFSDIGGDALDFSGSNVSIEKTKTNNVKDKAVSAGEKSTLTVKNSAFNNIGVGIASKDGSSVTVADTNISNYKLYGAMTYLKKDFYDMPSLTINNSSVSDGRAYIRQKGTSMTVDGVDIPETKISVKKLYKTKVMAK